MKSWLVPQRRAKSWSEPPFWALDQLRLPFLGGSTANEERVDNDYEGYVNGAYKSNGIVFACIDRRQQVFSQGRFQYRRYQNGQPQDLWGNQDLGLLETPWPNGTTGQLLAYMEYDASLAGSFYATTVDEAGKIGRGATGPGRRISRMRPDWVTLIIDAPSGDPYGLDTRVVAYQYKSPHGNAEPVTLLPSEVCHYSPKPDPTARFRGMSWLTPVIREVMADKAAQRHKLKFFENGAQPAMALKFDKDVKRDDFMAFVDEFNSAHQGVDNAYRTLFLANGADPVPLSMNFQQMDFKLTTTAGETRLSVASGVPAPILGISEGLSGSSLNEGNFKSARRLYVDTTISDLWGKATPSLSTLIPVPSGSLLEIDGRNIPFLREDATDTAEVQQFQAQTLRTLVDGGWEPDVAVQFLRTNDLAKLVGGHTGLLSVQLHDPSEPGLAEMPTLGQNGRTNGAQAALPR